MKSKNIRIVLSMDYLSLSLHICREKQMLFDFGNTLRCNAQKNEP